MKALILVGGYGTRLRPLTLSCPKPLVEFGNKPIVFHQIEALEKAGVSEIVLAVSYRPRELEERMVEFQKQNPNIKVHISQENEPLGTAGPIALAREILDDGDPFFVLNSDVICDYPFVSLLNFHKSHGGEGTLVTTAVADPSKYGVVLADETGQVDRFVEKPKQFVGDQINAGLYIFSPSFLNRIEPKPMSIEREIFPKVAADRKLYRFELKGFWMDMGQPKDYLLATRLYLRFIRSDRPDELTSTLKGSEIVENVLVHETAKIGKGCKIGPDVVIGANCVIGDGVRLSNCTLLEGVKVSRNAFVDTAIVGWHSELGAWSRLTNLCVLGRDVVVSDEISLNEVRVLPHKGVKQSCLEPTIIM